MPSLPIHCDLRSTELGRLSKSERDVRVSRRMPAIASALDRTSRAEAAKLTDMDRQTLQDWVIRCNEAGVEGLGTRWGRGRQRGRVGGTQGQGHKASCRPGHAALRLRIVDVTELIQARMGCATASPGRAGYFPTRRPGRATSESIPPRAPVFKKGCPAS